MLRPDIRVAVLVDGVEVHRALSDASRSTVTGAGLKREVERLLEELNDTVAAGHDIYDGVAELLEAGTWSGPPTELDVLKEELALTRQELDAARIRAATDVGGVVDAMVNGLGEMTDQALLIAERATEAERQRDALLMTMRRIAEPGLNGTPDFRQELAALALAAHEASGVMGGLGAAPLAAPPAPQGGEATGVASDAAAEPAAPATAPQGALP